MHKWVPKGQIFLITEVGEDEAWVAPANQPLSTSHTEAQTSETALLS